jgi:penicillin-binding protein 1C
MPPLPAYEAGCSDSLTANNPDAGEKPVILSPQPKIEYHARIDDPSEAVNFTANADGDVHTPSWFVDDTFLGNSAPGTPLFWQPQPGAHTVHVIDDHGRTDTTKVRVVLLQ